jgi:IclR family transcriptional regulator, pca regulon regulatory protein
MGAVTGAAAARRVGTGSSQTARDPNFMLSLARGLSAVRAFGEGRSQLTVADVARLTGFSRASARRCLHTLSVLGYASASGGRYELTPSILALGQAYLGSVAVARAAQPVLERVSEELHESSSVAVLDGDDIVYVARAAARRILSVRLWVGSRLPAACTSMGRVLLAGADDEARARYLRRVKLRRYTGRTITDRRALGAALDAVRAQGYAIVDQELELGLRACAVPIVGSDGRVIAALNTGVHASRADAATLKRDFVPVLKRAAQEIGGAP